VKLIARQRYDYRDASRAELLLTWAGHDVSVQAKRLRAESGGTDAGRLALYAALETVWEAKRRKGTARSSKLGSRETV
jgi:hypothetical protein